MEVDMPYTWSIYLTLCLCICSLTIWTFYETSSTHSKILREIWVIDSDTLGAFMDFLYAPLGFAPARLPPHVAGLLTSVPAAKRFGPHWSWPLRIDRPSASLVKNARIFEHMGVSKNGGTPKSSILIGFSIINHPFWGTPIFGNTHIYCWWNPKQPPGMVVYLINHGITG